MKSGKQLLTMMMLALSILPAWAGGKAGWVTTESLNARSQPSTSSDRVATLTRGEKVTVLDVRADHWCKAVLPGGKRAWVREEYLKLSSGRSGNSAGQVHRTAATPAWIEPVVVNMRREPDLGAGVVGQLKRGEKVYVVARDGSWRKIKAAASGEYGWVRADLLEGNAHKAREFATAPREEKHRPAWVNANIANVRSGPSTGYSRVGQFTRGAKIHVLERRDDWARCKGAACTGWILAELLESDVAKGRELAADGGSNGRDKAYCVANVANLREGPGTGSDRLANVREGATLWVLGEKSGWCKVQTEEGATGWMAGWYVRRHGANTTVAQAPAAPAVAATVQRTQGDKSQAFRAWIAEDQTNVRYGPGVDTAVKFQLASRTPVQVVDTEGQWCKLRTDAGTTGWAAGWVLDFQPPGQPEATKVINGEKQEVKAGWVNRPTVNVRTNPDTTSPVATRAGLGTELVITGARAGWYKVAMSDGTQGWVSGNLVKTRAENLASEAEPQSELPSGDASSRGRAIMREAMSHLGKAYVRGTSGPDTFDCSGFTSYVYRQFGIDLPRTTDGQYLRGRPVSRDDLQPGDILVFQNTYRAGISHVGLYVGQGKFIHASNSRSGVKISDLDDSYYAPRYVGARRMF